MEFYGLVSLLFTLGFFYVCFLGVQATWRTLLKWLEVSRQPTKNSPSSLRSRASFSPAEIDASLVPERTVPASRAALAEELQLEVRRKDWFFTRAESAAFHTISRSLEGQPLTVLSKVRLLDLFLVPDRPRGNSTRNRLIQKHVDFVIISLPECCPVLAIELDGASHANAKQQARDAVKDAAFAKSGLQLVRIENGQVTKNRVLALLKPHLKPEPVLA
jgi:Protein of unknown function (DUF2726)